MMRRGKRNIGITGWRAMQQGKIGTERNGPKKKARPAFCNSLSSNRDKVNNPIGDQDNHTIIQASEVHENNQLENKKSWEKIGKEKKHRSCDKICYAASFILTCFNLTLLYFTYL
ncbi:MAG: hypothetical protein CL912_23005 [Deltaproteobacteria bacterium]|nr:hypothetical protein [Deltaproteobacteria bacterium]|tara:strand:+ start:2773 stop:3117 length:345 start_codon:yes stop_codon:yes gene_type:complete